MEDIIWRPVVGYEGLYEVSNTGQVRSLNRYVKGKGKSYRLQKGKMLSPIKNKDGYLQVNLCCNGKNKMFLVHRLSAQAFLPNPDNLPEINHKDEDKTNNIVDNLEWCDRSYNNNYGTRKDKVRESKLKSGYWTGLSKDEYIKKYYEENKESIKKYKKKYNHKYYQDNKDRIIDSQRSYYQENTDKLKEYKKKYDQDNKEKIREYHHLYYLKRKQNIQNNL